MNNQIREARQIKPFSRDTYNSFRPINWLLNTFLINSNVEDTAYSKAFYILKCLLALAALGSINIFSLYYKHTYIYKHHPITQSVKLTDTVQLVYDLVQYIVDLCFVYKCRRHISLEYFNQYGYIDAILDMTCYAKIKLKLTKMISLFTFIWLWSSSCDFVSWYFSYGLVTPAVYSVAYMFLYIKMLTTLDLSSHVMHIKCRLVIIADILLQYYSKIEPQPGIMSTFTSDQWWAHAKLPPRSTKLKPCALKLQSANECMEINLLARCYLKLIEQVKLINSIFGVRILLNSLSLLIDIIRFTNIAVRIVVGSQVTPNETRYLPAASSMMRQLTCVLVLASLVNQCEKVYRQRDRIIDTIDHILINKNPSDELRVALTEFRGLVQARPISFNLANFFRLDNSFLVSISSVVVTYTIIILQSLN